MDSAKHMKTNRDFLKTVIAASLGLAIAAPFGAQAAGYYGYNPGRVTRELDTLRDAMKREHQEEAVQEMRKAQQQPSPIKVEGREKAPEGLQFVLKKVNHSPSTVLTDEEIDSVTKAYVGREVTATELSEMLERVNNLYAKKGFAVCRAMLRRQRIHDGELFMTLIEGKTGEVEIKGNKHTREMFIDGALPLKKGEVTNHSELVDDLTWFNMVNDIDLTVDIHAGKAPGTTDYTVTVMEPPNYTAGVFFDTSGARDTGRPRAGVSFMDRSVLGFRDSLTMLGLKSEGTHSFLAAYSVPLNRMGTRLTASYSTGKVEQVNGPSADLDVLGESRHMSLRLDQPLYVDATKKFTLYVEGLKEHAETKMSNVRLNDTDINSVRAGVETVFLWQNASLFLSAGIMHAEAENHAMDYNSRYRVFEGDIRYQNRFAQNWSASFTGSWQAKLQGDPMTAQDYFYLGHISGVRGYDNDVVSGENGFWTNTEISYYLGGDKENRMFAFYDNGHVSGLSNSGRHFINSVGAGVSWKFFNLVNVTGTVSVPLTRKLKTEDDPDDVRLDLTVSAFF